LECTVFGYYLDMASILWHYIMLHCIALHWHMELCHEPMVPTVPVQHRLLGITMQGYEGRSSYASMCIHYWFGIEMQLRTLMGMKAGDHVHLYAFLYGFGSWM